MASNSANFSGARPSPSVFDSYNRGIRGNVLRGTLAFINSWSDCDFVLRYNRICAYVITVLLVFVLCAVLFKWPFWLIVTLLSFILLVSMYNSALASQKFCFNILGTE